MKFSPKKRSLSARAGTEGVQWVLAALVLAARSEPLAQERSGRLDSGRAIVEPVAEMAAARGGLGRRK